MTNPSVSGPRRSRLDVLTDLYQSRGVLVGVITLIVGILLITLTPQDSTQLIPTPDGGFILEEQKSFWTRFRLEDVGSALFQTGLVITIFQVMLDQSASDRFAAQVDTALKNHRGEIQGAVARSLSAGENLESLKLSAVELDNVIERAVTLRTGSPELGTVVQRKLKTGVFEAIETWRNLVVQADIHELLASAPGGLKYDYYRVYFSFGYHTTNNKRSRFALKVARWRDEYDPLLRDAGMGAVWRLPSTGEFDDDWAEGFRLHGITYGGQRVDFQKNEVEREYTCALPVDEFTDREDVFLQYTFEAVVFADANLLSFEVPRPTFSAIYTISVNVPDIVRMRAYDYFGLTRPASIEYTPDLESARRVTLAVDDWILPRAGAIVVWKRS